MRLISDADLRLAEGEAMAHLHALAKDHGLDVARLFRGGDLDLFAHLSALLRLRSVRRFGARAAEGLIPKGDHMNLNLLFCLAGLVGSALRAASTYSHDTFTAKSITDVIVGGIVGVLYPLSGAPLPTDPWQAAAVVAGASYVGASVLQGVLGRLGEAKHVPILIAAFGPQRRGQ